MWCERSRKAHLVFLWFFMTFLYGAEVHDAAKKEPKMHYPVITVVFDHNPYQKGMQSGWGFSCLIGGMEKRLLFDTGANAALKLR
ncbi:MAG: hypothetical protein PHO65_00450 [Sulfurovum sp.]|nr:hypothetical protein [Sulfurovum sp.]